MKGFDSNLSFVKGFMVISMDYHYEIRSVRFEAWITNNLDYMTHMHEEIEIGFCFEGGCDLYVEDKKYHLGSGEAFLIFPNQIHSYENSENLKAFVCITGAENIYGFKDVFSTMLPVSPIMKCNARTTELAALIESAIHECRRYGTEVVQGLAAALCGMLLENEQMIKTDSIGKSISTEKTIMRYCNEHYTEHITIDDAAKALYMSRSHIAHVFKNKLHSTFYGYINAKRINHACTLLSGKKISVTDAAFESGFDSVRTFNRLFLKHVGCSPREFKSKGHYEKTVHNVFLADSSKK